jgi:hypothetical protein
VSLSSVESSTESLSLVESSESTRECGAKAHSRTGGTLRISVDRRNSGKIQMPPPHEYYICNVSQRPTQQKSTSKGGGLSEVPSLIHNGVLMYMRTVTEPRGTLPSVCAPAGLRRPCAHTSDSRIPIRHHLSNPQKSSIPLQTTPRRCIGTIDIVEPVFGGLGPATYRSAEAPVVSEVRRGARDTYAEYESPTLYRQKWWCMHGTRGSTHTVTRNSPSVPPATKKPSFRTSRTSRPHAIMQTRGGARKRVHDSGHPPTHESARGTGAISARYHPAASETLTRYQRDVSEISAR